MMRADRWLICFASFALALGAAVCSAQILNSERIEQTFGSYGIDVLHSDDSLRLSSLFSTDRSGKTTRTFAIVGYPAEIAPAFAALHERILDGGSIGATFTAAGWNVVKINVAIAGSEAPRRVAELMRIEAGAHLATHIYRLDIERAGESYRYATIIEMHHPQYLDLTDLAEIYSASGPAQSAISGPALALLRRGLAVLAASALGE